MKYKKVTNNLVDVFFGKYGFDSKERVRMKRGNGTWLVSGTPQARVRDAEIEFGAIRRLEDVLPQIIKDLSDGKK